MGSAANLTDITDCEIFGGMTQNPPTAWSEPRNLTVGGSDYYLNISSDPDLGFQSKCASTITDVTTNLSTSFYTLDGSSQQIVIQLSQMNNSDADTYYFTLFNAQKRNVNISFSILTNSSLTSNTTNSTTIEHCNSTTNSSATCYIN